MKHPKIETTIFRPNSAPISAPQWITVSAVIATSMLVGRYVLHLSSLSIVWSVMPSLRSARAVWAVSATPARWTLNVSSLLVPTAHPLNFRHNY